MNPDFQSNFSPLRADTGQALYEVGLVKMIVENRFLRRWLHESVAFLYGIIMDVPAFRPFYWVPSGLPLAKDFPLSMTLRSEGIVL